MGLDMSLNKRFYISNYPHSGEKMLSKCKTIYDILGEEYKDRNCVEVVFSVIKWRKNYDIHEWFVKNIQGGVDNCCSYPVEIESLVDLRDIISTLLETKDTSSYFFSRPRIDDDEYYWEDMERTKKELDKIIKEYEKNEVDYGYPEPTCTFEYQSSW